MLAANHFLRKSKSSFLTELAIVVIVGIAGSVIAWEYGYIKSSPLIVFAMLLSSYATYQLLMILSSSIIGELFAEFSGIFIFSVGMTLDQLDRLIPDVYGTAYFLATQIFVGILCARVSRKTKLMLIKMSKLSPASTSL